MARSNYLRSLAGPLPANASLLRPPRVPLWARPRVMEAFGKDADPPRSVAEPSIPASGLPAESILAGVSPRTPVEAHPVPEQHFHERESASTLGLQPVAEPVRPAPPAIHAERL